MGLKDIIYRLHFRPLSQSMENQINHSFPIFVDEKIFKEFILYKKKVQLEQYNIDDNFNAFHLKPLHKYNSLDYFLFKKQKQLNETYIDKHFIK